MKKKTGIYLRNLPQEERDQFKAACAKQGRSMTGMVRAFIKDVSNEGKGIIDFEKLDITYPDPK